MKKVVSSIFLFAMIVVIPAVSYMFLTKGIDYRLESLEALKAVDSIEVENYFGDNVALTNHVTLISTKNEGEVIDKLYDQFKQGPGFQLLTFADYKGADPTIDNAITLDTKIVSKIKSRQSFSGASYVLIDGDRKVRKVYASDDEKQEIERHIATILPYVEKKKRRKKDE